MACNLPVQFQGRRSAGWSVTRRRKLLANQAQTYPLFCAYASFIELSLHSTYPSSRLDSLVARLLPVCLNFRLKRLSLLP